MENIDRHAASQPDNVLGNITRSFITVHFSGEVLGLQDFVIYQRSFVPYPSSSPSTRHWKLQYKSPSQDDTDRDIFIEHGYEYDIEHLEGVFEDGLVPVSPMALESIDCGGNNQP
ncbi:hypothetical protein KQX54_004226 [Cotesia glomerata]|uniref:Uncharacterized protein n=1 Tax=Cotesia glomerata TaxID=32391 RepID=A0AAV7IAX8_COTGL|nr:hypothetical protein KQX54_004226 [Cotesia glomerata]